jgi:hypothetical protein
MSVIADALRKAQSESPPDLASDRISDTTQSLTSGVSTLAQKLTVSDAEPAKATGVVVGRVHSSTGDWIRDAVALVLVFSAVAAVALMVRSSGIAPTRVQIAPGSNNPDSIASSSPVLEVTPQSPVNTHSAMQPTNPVDADVSDFGAELQPASTTNQPVEEGIAAAATSDTSAQPIPFHLTGVMRSSRGMYAIINGVIAREGDTLDHAIIDRISATEVRLKIDGKHRILRLNHSAPAS